MFLDGRSCHTNLKDGGALQISIKRFQVDFYPYHLAKGKSVNKTIFIVIKFYCKLYVLGDRKHWPTYNSSSVPHTMWQEQAFASFKTKFMDLFDHSKTHHIPLSRMPKVSL